MKKLLLLGSLSVIGLTSWGEISIRQVAPDMAMSNVSRNGRYVASSLFGDVTIFDLETGKRYDFIGDEDAGNIFSLGMGNALADNGVGVGSTLYSANACVVEDGVWTELPVAHSGLTNLAQGITPDARRICGQVGNASMSTNTTEVMCLPCIWERQDDGTYRGPIYLPHPEKDFTGRVPIYITALAISDDGRTIAGQVCDFSGFMVQPIVYKENESGEWSYQMLFPELANPDGIVLPPDPGEAPQNAPDMQNYMTPEELAEYYNALSKWELAGGSDWSTYPEMEDYMSAEGLAAFNKAVDKYSKEIEEWLKLAEPYNAALSKIMEKASSFLFNTVVLSPDGKVYASCTLKDVEDPTSWTGISQKYCPVFMDIENNELKSLEFDESLIVTCVTSDYSILANTRGNNAPKQAYIAAGGENNWELLNVWLNKVDPEVGEWFSEVSAHTVEVMDADGMMQTFDDYICSGIAVCSADMGLFATYSEVFWDSDISNFTESYVFTVNTKSSVKTMDSDNKEIETIHYFSLDGKQLSSAPVKGLTIRRTIYKDGSVKSEKVVL